MLPSATRYNPSCSLVQTRRHSEHSASSLQSIGELKQHLLDNPTTASGGTEVDAASFEIHVCAHEQCLAFVEVSALQAAADHSVRSLFQVASNFNCIELANPGVCVDSGTYVTQLMDDSTQGPAAASGAGVCAITRTYATFYNAALPPDAWGQTTERQVELLGHPEVERHFPVTNGKLYVERVPDPLWAKLDGAEREQLLDHMRVGLHVNCVAHFTREPSYVPNKVVMRALHPPAIDQAYVAAMNLRAYGARILTKEEQLSKMKFLLDGAYQATYAAAAVRGTSALYLTCVGGGSFANPLREVGAAIARAHLAWAPSCPTLRKVILPLFEVGSDPNPFAEPLVAAGVRVVVVTYNYDSKSQKFSETRVSR